MAGTCRGEWKTALYQQEINVSRYVNTPATLLYVVTAFRRRYKKESVDSRQLLG